MAFTNMKKPKKTEKETKARMAVPYDDEEKYPYGLEIHLNEDSLKKLGLGAGNFLVKKTFTITAKVKVTGVRAREERNDTSDNVDLQITDLDLGKQVPKKSLFASFNEIQNAEPE